MAAPTYREALLNFALHLKQNKISSDLFMQIKRDFKFTTMQYFDACLPTPRNRKLQQPNGEIKKDCDIPDKLTDLNIVSLMHLAIGLLENAKDAPEDERIHTAERIEADEPPETPYAYTLRTLQTIMMRIYTNALRRNSPANASEVPLEYTRKLQVFIRLGLDHAIFTWNVSLIAPWIEFKHRVLYHYYIRKYNHPGGILPRNRRLSGEQLEELLKITIENAAFDFLHFIYLWSTVYTDKIASGFWSLPSALELFKLKNAPRGSLQRIQLITRMNEDCFGIGAIIHIAPDMFWNAVRQPAEIVTDFGAILAFKCLLCYYAISEANKAAIHAVLEYFIQTRFVHDSYLLEFVCVLTREYFDCISPAMPIPENFTFISTYISNFMAGRFDGDKRQSWAALSNFFQDTPDATKEEWTTLIYFILID